MATSRAVLAATNQAGLYQKVIDGLTGNWVKRITAAGLEAFRALGPWIVLMLIPLFCMGISLAYYLPAMPFIAWVSAFVGWILLVCETILAASVWAVASSLPEGEGLAGQHGRTGYMLLLGVMLRPPLMMVGFLTAILIMPLIGGIVGVMFGIYSRTVAAQHVTGPVSIFAMMFLCGFIYVIVAHKVLS